MAKKKAKTSISAAEFIEQLKRDPEWVRENAAREAAHKAAAAKIQAEIEPEEAPLLAALAQLGYRVTSVWDFVNTSESYAAAVPVLCKFLRVVRHPRLREGIVRALTVKEARGVAGREILDQLKRDIDPPSSEARWVIANALTVVADAGMADEIRSLAADPHFEDLRERLMASLKRLRR